MPDESDNQKLLVEIHIKLNSLLDRFERISEGEGFTRCVNREGRIRRLEQDVISMKKDMAETDDVQCIKADIVELKKNRTEFDTWLMRITWAIIICGVVKTTIFPAGAP